MIILETSYEYASRPVTALNELAILDMMGHQGWEMIDLGPNRVHFRRPRRRAALIAWEYQRKTSAADTRLHQEMLNRGWMPAGDWALFHYFKRPARLLPDDVA